MIFLPALLVPAANAQVGPTIAPDTTNPAGDVEVGVSTVGYYQFYANSSLLQVGSGAHMDWSPSDWLTANMSLYGLDPVYASNGHGRASLQGFAGLDAGYRLGPTRLGLWSGAGRVGVLPFPSVGDASPVYTTALYGGPSLTTSSSHGRVSLDLHLSALLCTLQDLDSDERSVSCPLFEAEQATEAIDRLAYILASSELGLDLIANDRDSIRFAMTSFVPTVGWKGRFDRVDVSVLWGSAILLVNFLQIRIDTHPLQWKHPVERTDPTTAWVERPAR